MSESDGAPTEEGRGHEERRAWVVRGRVQGVGFRWSTVQKARSLGVKGSVWNRPDGAVEIHARGSGDALDALRQWLGEGPSHARVESLESVEPGSPAEVEGFQVRRTGA